MAFYYLIQIISKKPITSSFERKNEDSTEVSPLPEAPYKSGK